MSKKSSTKKGNKTEQARATREANASTSATNETEQGPSSEPTSERSGKTQVSPATKLAIELKHLHASVGRRMGRMQRDGWEGVEAVDAARAACSVANTSLEAAIAALEGLGADWKPRRTRIGIPVNTVQIEPGSKVDVRESKREEFKDVLEAKEMVNLVVISARGKKVICRTPTDVRVVFKRGEVVPQSSDSASA